MSDQHTYSSTMLSNEEREMVRDLILLPYIDTMVGKSISEIERSGNLLGQAYLQAGRYVQRRIMADIYKLKQELKRRNIKVVDDANEDFLLYYMIYFRGYQERFGMTRDVMRTQISLRLTAYTAEIGNALK
ncbi:hypothetical protein [Paenibacillus typhae]|uniref:hypothetical protein n=1 Tax=Paenibacillus typhae TaxID=1174501 RepID=UPI001C8D3D77|nr:hypothetical protein [Paenibacillus typhae]MBY0011515.1 hypothetical protein [Paenibacillus typhae]